MRIHHFFPYSTDSTLTRQVVVRHCQHLSNGSRQSLVVMFTECLAARSPSFQEYSNAHRRAYNRSHFQRRGSQYLATPCHTLRHRGALRMTALDYVILITSNRFQSSSRSTLKSCMSAFSRKSPGCPHSFSRTKLSLSIMSRHAKCQAIKKYEAVVVDARQAWGAFTPLRNRHICASSKGGQSRRSLDGCSRPCWVVANHSCTVMPIT